MESHNSASDAAAMVAIKREYNADTDDDEAVTPAADKNSASCVASVVAVKKEYNDDTDDEAAADKSSASDVASMVAVKTEYNADTDSDEEQQQQPNKKTKRDDNEHEKYLAEIRKITDQLLSLGRLDGAKLEQVKRIAHDLKSFSVELEESIYNIEREFRRLAKTYMAEIQKSTDQLLFFSRDDGARSKQFHRIANDLESVSNELRKSAESFSNELKKKLKNGAVVKTEYDADTDSDEQKQPPNKKAKRDDNEHEKYLAKIREITDQLLSLGRRDGAMLKQVYRVAHDLELFSIELKKTAYDVEEKLVEVLVEDDDNSIYCYIRHRAYLCSMLVYLCSGDNDADDGDHVWIRFTSDIDKRVRVAKSRIYNLEEALRDQSAMEESWEQFERKNGLKVWARDSDNPNAQQHLAYLCSGHNGADDGHYVWIRWDSDIGKRVRVPKSRIDNLEGAYSKIYAWCGGYKLYMLPYNRFVFWRKLLECKTWGDMKAMSNDKEIEMFTERYEMRWDDVEEDNEKHINNLTDDTVVDFDGEGGGEQGDFDLQEHGDYGDDTITGSFPPVVEQLMYDEFLENERWVRKYGKVVDGWNNMFFQIECGEQETLLNDMEKLDLVTIRCPQMSDIFESYHGF